MRTLVGSLVTLRPITEADLPSVARASMPWAQQGESEADVLGRLRDRFRGQAAFAALDYVIEIDGHGIGNIQARQDAYLLGLFEIGIVVFEDADKSKGVGREALARADIASIVDALPFTAHPLGCLWEAGRG